MNKNTSPEKSTHGSISLQGTKSGARERFLRPDCMAKAGSKGVGEGGTPTCGHIVRAKYYTPDLTNMNIQ